MYIFSSLHSRAICKFFLLFLDYVVIGLDGLLIIYFYFLLFLPVNMYFRLILELF